jgi:glycosyltransferase involved in cell wall biosynthesis
MHVTVCICTRDRGRAITATLCSLADSAYEDFDVVIVDQSAAGDTAEAVRQATAGDARFAYIRSQSTGASSARNVGVAHARGPIIAFTDDDCDVPREWLSLIVRYFGEHPDVAQICGEVRAGPHDASAGFIPTYAVRSRRRIASPWLKWREGGIGANMAFRLDVLRNVGPFDTMLGPGAPLYNCEDGDMTYRVLRAGHSVLNVPDVYVIHRGFRTWQEGRVMMRHTGIAVGAAYMKHLRLGDMAVLPTLLFEWIRCISWSRLLLLRKHSGLARFLAYAHGMKLSFRYGTDRRMRLYAAPATPQG